MRFLIPLTASLSLSLPVMAQIMAPPVISEPEITDYDRIVEDEISIEELYARQKADSIEAAYREFLRVREVEDIISSLPESDAYALPFNKMMGPWIFSGFRVHPSTDIAVSDYNVVLGVPSDGGDIKETPLMTPGYVPDWIRRSMVAERIQDYAMYRMMMDYPHMIQYAYWDLPVPPTLPEDDHSFQAYIARLDLPEVDPGDAVLPEITIKPIHWLHKVGTSLQFSEAYVSSNWYQGGNSSLSLLFNFGWNVQLNPTYHPNLLFESNLTYKLGLTQNPENTYHKYSISEDIFQYNAKVGYKAKRNWYYSLTTQFKTQFFNSYPANSLVRSASFLSPGDLNVGLGMTYSFTNKDKTTQFNASLAPLSYNLKTCIDPKIDPTLFNIKPGHKAHHEFGSSAELTLSTNLRSNISCKSRLFLFTDYSYFLGDLETTFSFYINRFLSTQIYAHLRYDSSTNAMSTRWRHWMLKELLSFGLTYTFSTKPI